MYAYAMAPLAHTTSDNGKGENPFANKLLFDILLRIAYDTLNYMQLNLNAVSEIKGYQFLRHLRRRSARLCFQQNCDAKTVYIYVTI